MTYLQALTRSQVQKTNPNPYDQILLVSQASLNDALENMYLLAPDDSLLLKFSRTLRDGQSLNANLLTPRVSLQVTSQDPQLYYFMKMDSGTMKLYVSEEASDTTMKTFDVSGWEIAFPIKISRKIVKEGDTEYADYASKVGFKNGVFSIAMLYIDACSTAIYDKDKSSFGTVDWSKETSAVRSNFGVFMSQWLSQASENKTNVIGLSIQGADINAVNSTAPSFVPTSIDYYMYPWHDPSKDAIATSKADDLDQNALCYLTMSKFATPPDPIGLPYSGAFVDKGDNGVLFCMNTKLFWNLWLLPLLNELNQGTQLLPTQPYLEVPTGSDAHYDFTTRPELTFGANPSHTTYTDSYFAFKSASAGNLWSWDGGQLTSEKTLVNHGHTIKASETGTSSTSVSFESGGQKISITGKSTFYFGLKYQNEDVWANFTTNTNWHLNFALESVTDGGLQITRVADPTGVSPSTTTYTDASHNLIWKAPYDDFCKSLSKWVEDYFTSSLGWLTNALVNALQHQHQLFLPASGVFLMHDPRFNSRGDLLVGLHYNGAPAPSNQPATTSDITTNTVTKASTKITLSRKLVQKSDMHRLDGDHIPEAFRHVPKARLNLPARQRLVPEHLVRAKVEMPRLPAFTVKAHA